MKTLTKTQLRSTILTLAIASTLSCQAGIFGARNSKSSIRQQPSSGAETSKDSSLLTVFSWNMLNFGLKKKKSLEEYKVDIWSTLARAFKNADLIALQEINTKDFKPAIQYVRKSLLNYEKSGEFLCVGYSNMSDVNASEAERFAFIWRDSRVRYVTTQGVEQSCAANPEMDINFPLLTAVGSQLGRMPTYGTFVFYSSKEKLVQKKGEKFYYVNLHLRPTQHHPENEIPALAAVFTSANDSRNVASTEQAFFRSAKLPVVISGDFNLGSGKYFGRKKTERKYAFQPLMDAGFEAALDNEPTSLGTKERKLKNPYDNFWFRSGADVKLRKADASVHNLYDLFPDLEVKEIYQHISDHSPIEARFEFVPKN